MNICSVIVRTRPEHIPVVEAALGKIDLCEIHFRDDEGRIVVTIEGVDSTDEMTKLRAIQELPHVLSADLTYAYFGEEYVEEEA